ncbi:MAG: class I SAM-dependent methyltransferase [Thaumarchaeota archaeon]|nr:class I SAM-dependent methyltransferase [Nitrososphaerota archaeon]
MDSDDLARMLMSDERREWQDPEAILESAGVAKGMTVADLGCGPGFFTLPVASIVGPSGLVYAIDSSPTMLRHLRRSIKAAGVSKRAFRIIEADVSRTGIPAATVDVALFANVLHDIDDKRSFLEEVRRICRKGAAVVDVDWKKSRTESGPPHRIRLSASEARTILSENGFCVLRPFEAGPFHYGLVFRDIECSH